MDRPPPAARDRHRRRARRVAHHVPVPVPVAAPPHARDHAPAALRGPRQQRLRLLRQLALAGAARQARARRPRRRLGHAARREVLLLLEYINRQFAPTLTLDLYRFPSPSSFYGNSVLVEDLTGGDLSATLPLDVIDRPFTDVLAGARLRYAYASPLNLDDFTDLDSAGDSLLSPEAGTRADVQVGLAYKFQRPYRYNVIAPFDGTGARFRATFGAPVLGADRWFARPDLLVYTVSPALPFLGGTRLFAQGRATAVFGQQLAQDYVGLSRTDDVDVQLPFVGAVTLDDAERVRGYRRFAVGTRALFGSVELRAPVIADLQTTVLGLVRLGAVAPALFVDGGLVWSGSSLDNAVRRVGVGAEVKNVVSIGGFEILHAVGVATRASRLGDVFDGTIRRDDLDIYYRIQAAVPF